MVLGGGRVEANDSTTNTRVESQNSRSLVDMADRSQMLAMNDRARAPQGQEPAFLECSNIYTKQDKAATAATLDNAINKLPHHKDIPGLDAAGTRGGINTSSVCKDSDGAMKYSTEQKLKDGYRVMDTKVQGSYIVNDGEVSKASLKYDSGQTISFGDIQHGAVRARDVKQVDITKIDDGTYSVKLDKTQSGLVMGQPFNAFDMDKAGNISGFRLEK